MRIFTALAILIFLLFITSTPVQATYYAPYSDPYQGNANIAPACYGSCDTVPLNDCTTYGGQVKDNICYQVPWTFKYAASCEVCPEGLGPRCDYTYQYQYNSCDTSDRCYGSSIGASGYDSAGRILPGICYAEAYDNSDPNTACISGSQYKTCCSSNGNYPVTYCSSGICPAGSITSAGTTICTVAPAPTATPTPIPPPATCSLTNSYTQCGGDCASVTYPSNHTVNVYVYTCTDESITYSCTDSGAIPGQCGNPIPTLPPGVTPTSTPTPTPVPAPIPISGVCAVPNATLSWSTVSGANYQYAVMDNSVTTPTWSNPIQANNNTTVTYSPTTSGHIYDWTVAACIAPRCSVWSAVSSFTCPTPTPTPTLAPGQPPAPDVTFSPNCINAGQTWSGSQLQITWSAYADRITNPVTWVDISSPNDSSYSPSYYHERITNSATFSIPGPTGFNLTPDPYSPPPHPLSISPNVTYYARLMTTVNGPSTPFYIPTCAVSTATPGPGVTTTPTNTPPAGRATNTPAPAGAPGAPAVIPTCNTTGIPPSKLNITKSAIGTTNYYQIIIREAVVMPNFPALIDTRDYYPIGSIATGDSWGVNACNTSTSCSGVSGTFTCSNVIRPWIFVDGDVHSNTKINTPGGPP